MRSLRHMYRRMSGRGNLGRWCLCNRSWQVHRLRHLRRRLPERSDQARIILQEGIKKLFPRKEELFYCLFPSGSADTPETRGRSTHTACRRSGIHNSFPADFNGRSRFRRPLIRYAPKHPRKGFRGKVEIHRTIAAGPCITGHRKTRVQGFCRKRTFPFAESIYYT